MLELTDLNSAIAGKRLAERLDLKPGDKVLVLGVLADRYLELQVKGIYESQSPMDDEALVPLYAGHWLRGTDNNYVTVIRVKIDRVELSPSKLSKEIATLASQPAQINTSEGETEKAAERILPIMETSFKPEDIDIKEVQKFMRSHLDRYGVTKEALLILSITIFILASASVSQRLHNVDMPA